jgi:hypothetical protein
MVEGALGDVKDELAARVAASNDLRLPLRAPTDALDDIGEERLIVRGLTETDTVYAARLQNAWAELEHIGTAFGMLKQLLGLGYSDCFLETRTGNAYTMDGAGVMTRSAAPLSPNPWSHFDLLFVPTLPASWGTLPASDSEEVNRIRKVIREWKPGHTICDAIVVVGAGARTWLYPLRTWSAGGTWATGGTVTTWSP